MIVQNMKYTKEEILLAGEIDVVSLLDEVRKKLRKKKTNNKKLK